LRQNSANTRIHRSFSPVPWKTVDWENTVYTTLKFLALQGAPYIYDISRLRVNDTPLTGW
jgi:hypothetical protein